MDEKEGKWRCVCVSAVKDLTEKVFEKLGKGKEGRYWKTDEVQQICSLCKNESGFSIESRKTLHEMKVPECRIPLSNG